MTASDRARLIKHLLDVLDPDLDWRLSGTSALIGSGALGPVRIGLRSWGRGSMGRTCRVEYRYERGGVVRPVCYVVGPTSGIGWAQRLAVAVGQVLDGTRPTGVKMRRVSRPSAWADGYSICWTCPACRADGHVGLSDALDGSVLKCVDCGNASTVSLSTRTERVTLRLVST